MSQLADVLRYLRVREGLTQQQMADKISLMSTEKISRSRINNYENDIREPDFEMLELLADFFNVDMNTLSGKDYSNRKPVIMVDDGKYEKYMNFMQVLFQLPEDYVDEVIEKAQSRLRNQKVQDDQ